MKRILPLILTVLLLPALLAVPVMADEGSPWVELLEYGTANNSGSNYINLSHSGDEFYYDLPAPSLVFQIDLIIFSRNPVTAARIGRNGANYTDVTVHSLGNDLYRIYMNSQSRYSRVNVQLDYSGSGTNETQIMSFRVSLNRFARQTLNVSGKLWDYSNRMEEHFVFYNSAGEMNIPEWTTGTEDGLTAWSCDLEIEQYPYYDYLELTFYVTSASVNSIQVLRNSDALPFETNMVENGGNGHKRYDITVRIDLTDITHTSSYKPQVIITGSGVAGLANNFCIASAYGYYHTETLSPLSVWFSRLQSWLNDGFSSIVDALGGSNDASGVTDNINAAVGELQQAGAALDSVQRPDIDQVNIDVVGMVDPAGLSGVASIVGLFTGNSLIYSIMIMFVTLALISFILYGKR